MKTNGMAAHEPAADHLSAGEGIWLTPPAVLHFLGKFDLDPCAAPEPRPWATAERHIAPPDDGLASPWTGRVWLNPPYGRDMAPWFQKMAEHADGIALTFARTETEAWQSWVWPWATAILFVAGRLTFRNPDGSRGKFTGGAPSALIAYGVKNVIALERSGIAGAIVVPTMRSRRPGRVSYGLAPS